jgi:mannose-6-phosphate isomerase
VDRHEAQSVIADGPLAGATLHDLWTNYRARVFGGNLPDTARFPLLFKLLDAREKLSVQVHPPAAVAPALSGEPKTEMWCVLDAAPSAELYAGLAPGTTREQFERALANGTCAALLHRLDTRAGDAIFIPSGRIHAIGGGNVIFEAQQNSDTTYRVYDWDRVGLDGKPRALHVAESMHSIDWSDYAPAFSDAADGLLAQCEHFAVTRHVLVGDFADDWPGFAVFMVASGAIAVGDRSFRAGEFFLRPVSARGLKFIPLSTGTVLLRTVIPSQG